MLEIVILVCSLAVSPLEDCTTANAVSVIRMPVGPVSPIVCAVQAQQYLAGTTLVPELNSDEQMKVICGRM